MGIHKKLVDILFFEREGALYNLIFNKEDGLGLTPASENFLLQLDQSLYTISYLEKLGLINVRKNSDNLFVPNCFDHYKLQGEKGEVSAFIKLNEEMEEKKSWWIEINSGLFHYRANGYMTDEEKREHRSHLLIIGSAILAAILTGLFTKLFDIYL